MDWNRKQHQLNNQRLLNYCWNVRLLFQWACCPPSHVALHHTVHCQHTGSTPTNSTWDHCIPYSDNTGDWLLNQSCTTNLALLRIIRLQLMALTSVSTEGSENEIELNSNMDWKVGEVSDYGPRTSLELSTPRQSQWKWGFPHAVGRGLNRTARDISNDPLSWWNIWCRLHTLCAHDLRHRKVTAVIYLSAHLTRLLPAGSCPQHHSGLEQQSSCKTYGVINLMFLVFAVKMRAMSTLIKLTPEEGQVRS